jgi:hypothetical protein
MHDLFLVLAYVVPTALALCFMLWVLWNLTRQILRRGITRSSLHRSSAPPRLSADIVSLPGRGTPDAGPGRTRAVLRSIR